NRPQDQARPVPLVEQIDPESSQLRNRNGGVAVLNAFELLHFLVAPKNLASHAQNIRPAERKHFETAEFAIEASDGHFPGLDVEVRTFVCHENAKEIC